MNRKYPNLKAAEKRRSNYLALVVTISFLTALAVGVYLQTVIGVVVGVVVASVLIWKLSRLVYSKIKVSCPICGSVNLNENYANTPRHSNAKVEHTCSDCGSFYIDGQLIESKDT
jgi:MFS superfamily sulfate permease-like transporter